MNHKKRRYHDKGDYPVLPPIPDHIHNEYQKLASTVQNCVDSHEILSKFYAFTDEYNKFVDTFSVCEKGCSYCCHIEVYITDLEAEYIEQKAKISRVKSLPNTLSVSKCPFLNQNNICSIYMYRPFACRTFHALDNPNYCKEMDVAHQTYGAAGGKGIPMLEALNNAIKQINGNNCSGDIREYFSQLRKSE
ncbi:YkgJ family cysteine cluster protein [Geobacter argillaceus]|uniref:Uncharacterized protein n=1 Tax=Geobacter argillaceus TaxID=345631 RepID=A0A562VML0_9BACT|nr:YkgJ family cysteine cluster protein [Geobacter argillaceus]TWJ19223.1 hypothetical protein JN12_01914 [Geobacter argillaceus]